VTHSTWATCANRWPTCGLPPPHPQLSRGTSPHS